MTRQEQHTLVTLPPEQQLFQLQQAAQPTVARLRRQQWFALLPVLLVMVVGASQVTFLRALCLGLLLLASIMMVGDVLVTAQARQRWRRLRARVADLAPDTRSGEAVGPLIEFSQWLTQFPLEDSAARATLITALERLLPRLDAPSARLLTESQRQFLRHCAEEQEPTVELVVGALLVLSSAGDQPTVPIARKLATSSSSQRIRDAAILCLEELGASP